MLRLPVTQDRDGNGKMWVAVNEVGCAVEWINDPGVFPTRFFPTFLCDDTVFGIRASDNIEYCRFGILVGSSHEVALPFAGNIVTVEATKVAENDFSGLSCCPDSRVHHGV